jgi:hypothetical protein
MNNNVYTGKGIIGCNATSKAALYSRGYSDNDIQAFQEFFQDVQNVNIAETLGNMTAPKGAKYKNLAVLNQQDFDISIECLALPLLCRSVMLGFEKETVTNIPKLINNTFSVSAGAVSLLDDDDATGVSLYTFESDVNCVHSVTYEDTGEPLIQKADGTASGSLNEGEYAIDSVGGSTINFNTADNDKTVRIIFYAESTDFTYRYVDDGRYAPVQFAMAATVSRVTEYDGVPNAPVTFVFEKLLINETWSLDHTNNEISTESFTFHSNGKIKKHTPPLD